MSLFTNQPKNNVSTSNAAKSSTTFRNKAKSPYILLIDDTNEFLIDDVYMFDLGSAGSTSFTNRAKS